MFNTSAACLIHLIGFALDNVEPRLEWLFAAGTTENSFHFSSLSFPFLYHFPQKCKTILQKIVFCHKSNMIKDLRTSVF